MSRKVTWAKFHQGLFIPGAGTIGDTLPSSSKTLKLEMFHTAEGLQVFCNNVEAVVPWANVILAVLAPEAASK